MKQNIGHLLVENGQISKEELECVLQEALANAEPTGRALLRLGLVNEDILKTILELHYGVNYLDLKKIDPRPDIVTLMPKETALELELIPITREGNRFTLAMVTPTDSESLNKAKDYFKDFQLNVVVCSDDGFQDFVTRAYPVSPDSPELNNQADSKQSNALSTSSTLAALEQQASEGELLTFEENQGAVNEGRAMVLLSHHILSNAINRGCTNIHIEPGERQILVHYRKEGVLFSARKLPKAILPDLVQRFKNMASRGEGESILPYDGLLNVRHGGQNFSFRLSIVPGVYGEHLVIWLE